MLGTFTAITTKVVVGAAAVAITSAGAVATVAVVGPKFVASQQTSSAPNNVSPVDFPAAEPTTEPTAEPTDEPAVDATTEPVADTSPVVDNNNDQEASDSSPSRSSEHHGTSAGSHKDDGQDGPESDDTEAPEVETPDPAPTSPAPALSDN